MHAHAHAHAHTCVFFGTGTDALKTNLKQKYRLMLVGVLCNVTVSQRTLSFVDMRFPVLFFVEGAISVV